MHRSISDFQTQFGGPSALKSLFIPSIGLLIVIFIAFFVVIGSIQQQSVKENSGERLTIYKTAFKKSFDKQASSLVSILSLLVNSEGISDAILEKNQQKLYERFSSTYQMLNESQGITHFYFHDTDLVNLIRLHEPTRYGDVISRKTSVSAKINNEVSYGFELGILGTFTIRAVSPIERDGNVIGYLEIGKEIEDIARDASYEYDLGWSILPMSPEIMWGNWFYLSTSQKS